MPRVAGQIDVIKNEAILDAAVTLLAERGDAASMEQIARRASVSKQTIYNHYGSKAELVRALGERRAHEITASLESPEAAADPRVALAAFARVVLSGVLSSRGVAIYRMAILAAVSRPEIARALYEAGPLASRRRLAEFLRRETAEGRLNTPDPQQAAEFFVGLVSGSRHAAALLGIESDLTAPAIEAIAAEAADRFLRAYAA